MIRYDSQRSEFAVAARGERALLLLVLVAVIAGGLIMLLDTTLVTQRGRWLSGAAVTMALVAFVPNRRWRIGLALAASGLLLVGVATTY